MFKRIMAAALCGVLALAPLTSCGKNLPAASSTAETAGTQGQFVAADIANYTAPQTGDQIIIMNIRDYGEVRIRLFPEYAPTGVENFIGLAEQGYYDGLTFHRVISDFMIQGGDPLGTGTGGQSLWGGKFEGGTDPHLIHLSGALCYANSGSTASNGSQFYIVTGIMPTDDYFTEYEAYGCTFTDEQKQLYKQYGGTPALDGRYTVFGQVISGLDIIFQIQNVETNAKDKPLTDVVIDSVKVGTYNGEEVKFYRQDYGIETTPTTTEAPTEPYVPEADYDGAAEMATLYAQAVAECDAEKIYSLFSETEISYVRTMIATYYANAGVNPTDEMIEKVMGKDVIIAALENELAEVKAAKGDTEWEVTVNPDGAYKYTNQELDQFTQTLGITPDAAVVYEDWAFIPLGDSGAETYCPSPEGIFVLDFGGEWHVSYLWKAMSAINDAILANDTAQ